MNARRNLHSLGRLIELREREVERLTAEVAAKQALRERYLGNLRRLEQLCAGTGASGAPSPALALNCAAYKQSVMQLADAHRGDLALHEADMALSSRALAEAARRREVLAQVHDGQQRALLRLQEAGEQKRQDEIAAQVWLRSKP